MVSLEVWSPLSSLALPDTFGESVASSLLEEALVSSWKIGLWNLNLTSGFWWLEMVKWSRVGLVWRLSWVWLTASSNSHLKLSKSNLKQTMWQNRCKEWLSKDLLSGLFTEMKMDPSDATNTWKEETQTEMFKPCANQFYEIWLLTQVWMMF